jgi:predicted lipoprotein with Yx(FWY)xxD motif
MKISHTLGTLLLTTTAWAQSPITIQKSVSVLTQKNQEPQTIERLILANSDGLSLYTFTPDKNGAPTCYDACAKAWPPVLVDNEKANELSGALATAPRKDGSLQLTVDGRPVYLFSGDGQAGDINGEGLGNIWFLIDLKLAK